MSNIDTTVSFSLFASARQGEKQFVAANEPGHAEPANQNLTAQQRSRTQVTVIPAPQHYARLNYDTDDGKVVVEVLNPQTGDILFRLPIEALSDDLVHAIADGRGSDVNMNA